jgi:hypothetical protein
MTCPPYFNGEIYSELYTYNKIEDFLLPMINNTLKVSKKFILVVNKKLKEIIKCNFNIKNIIEIKNTKSHFQSKNTIEYIVEI